MKSTITVKKCVQVTTVSNKTVTRNRNVSCSRKKKIITLIDWKKKKKKSSVAAVNQNSRSTEPRKGLIHNLATTNHEPLPMCSMST